MREAAAGESLFIAALSSRAVRGPVALIYGNAIISNQSNQ
jgi:hypothetical protein